MSLKVALRSHGMTRTLNELPAHVLVANRTVLQVQKFNKQDCTSKYQMQPGAISSTKDTAPDVLQDSIKTTSTA